MATVRLPDNGQEFPLEDEIAESDELLVEALRSFYPEIGTPKIARDDKRASGGVLTVSVVKQAGRKGARGEVIALAPSIIRPPDETSTARRGLEKGHSRPLPRRTPPTRRPG